MSKTPKNTPHTPPTPPTPPDAATVLASLLAQQERLWQRLRNELANDMTSLAESLADKAVRIRLEERPGRYVVNSLGEVQGRGAQIDTLCARLEAVNEEVCRLRNALHWVTQTPANDTSDAPAQANAQDQAK